MAGLPIFLTKNSVDIEIERFTSGTGLRNDLAEIVNADSEIWADRGVIDSLIEAGYTGRYRQDIQGKDIRQRFRLLMGIIGSGLPPTENHGLQTGDFVMSGDDRYEVGDVSHFDTHIEAIMYKV